MSLENGKTTLQIRKRDIDELIKTTWTDYGRIENIRTIRCANYKNILTGTDTINFRKDLVNYTVTGLATSTATLYENIKK